VKEHQEKFDEARLNELVSVQYLSSVGSSDSGEATTWEQTTEITGFEELMIK